MHGRAVAICFALPALLVFVGSCGDCAGVGRPAFEVTVVDARTGISVVDSAVVHVFRLPGFVRVDSATREWVPGRIGAAMHQSGRFTVVVERPGYYAWTAENRAVTSNCNYVETVFLTARLVKRDP
jgi:hypothetical protein